MRIRRFLSFLALPLSVLPLLAIVPQIQQSQANFKREHKMAPLSAPQIALTAAQKARFEPVAAYQGAVPVLAYHGITTGSSRDPKTISQRRFAEQMAALHQMGFAAISMEQYLRFQRGDDAGLPERPVLITFDDGRLDAYRSADAVLERYGYRATMFVVAGEVEKANPFYLTWKELHRMADSGRWDIQPNAYAGNERISVDSQGRPGSFYADRRYTRSGGPESLSDYERRVTTDVFAAKDAMAKHGFSSSAFGGVEPSATDDPETDAFLRDLLHRQFQVFFVPDERNAPDFTRPGQPTARYEVGATTTTDRLYMWLRDNAPRPEPKTAPAKPAAERAKQRTAKPGRRHHKRSRTEQRRHHSHHPRKA
jgi:biofilm PGA synthesis lipoprotein PgaB